MLDNNLVANHIDTVIDAALSEKRLIGTVVLVSHNGRVIHRRAAGFADRETGRPMQDDAIFRLASVSKLFVSVAAMVLVARERLALDANVTTWLPYFRTRLSDGTPAEITLRQLLSHTSGLSYGFFEPNGGPYHQAGVSDGIDRTKLTLEENLRRLAGVPLWFAPGTSWNYSLAIDVLGAVVEQAFGAPLPEAIRTLVMEPLELVDTGFDVRDPARLAAAYVNEVPEPRRMREPDSVSFLEGFAGIAMDPARAFDPRAFPSGGAGMIGTAGDVLRLLETLRNGGSPLLPEALVREMGRVQTGDLPITRWPGWGYGLGFSVARDAAAMQGPESPGTWRWGGVYGHSWFMDRARNLSVVALTNTTLEGMAGRFPLELCRAAYAAITAQEREGSAESGYV